MLENLAVPELPALIEAEQTRFRLPSQPGWIEPAADYLRHKAVLCGACLEAQGGKLMVALHEALSNSIIHGNLRISSELKERGDEEFARMLAARSADPACTSLPVDVVVSYDGEACRWIITDQGPGFDYERALHRATNPDPDELLSSGRGLMMMLAFLDEVRYEDGGRRIILTLYRRHKDGEKRHQVRVPMSDPVRVAPMSDDGSVAWDAAYEAVGRNVSQGGIALLQSRLATTTSLLLGIPAGDDIVYIPAEVRHMRSLGDGEVELGCRFLTPPVGAPALEPGGPGAAAEEAVADLVERLRQRLPEAGERRQHPRVNYTERIEIGGRPDEGVLYGFARDLARGGISFISTVPLGPEVRTLSLPQCSGKPPLRVRAKVVRCHKVMEGFYDVAAQFLGREV